MFLSAKTSITQDVELFGELLVSKYKNQGANTPPFLQLTNVPASNAFNPFGTTVRVSGVVQGAETLVQFSLEEQFVRPLLGVRGKLDTWQWEITALNARDFGSQVLTGQTNSAALNASLASADPNTALNPFRDGPMGSASLLGSIYGNTSVTNFSAESRIVDAFARGPLLQLPAGPLNAVVGAEYEDSSFNRGFDASRTARALFSELRIPLYAVEDERGARREVLAVQGAARYDHYSDFGSKTTGQAGFELRPIERLLLRGTYATAFKPPTLFQLGSPQTTFPTIVNDPKNGGATVAIQDVTGGNANLSPTTSTSSTLGFVWSPAQVRGLDLSATRWWSRTEGAIAFPLSDQFVVDNEASFPGRVIRDSAGQIVSVDRTFINFGVLHEDGVDVAASWTIPTQFGSFTPALAGTCVTRFDGPSTPGGASIDRLSHARARPPHRRQAHAVERARCRDRGRGERPGRARLRVACCNGRIVARAVRTRAETSVAEVRMASARRIVLRPALAWLLCAWAGCAVALDPALDIGQYAHTAWKIRDGFSRGSVITAFAQGADGYLWLGSESG